MTHFVPGANRRITLITGLVLIALQPARSAPIDSVNQADGLALRGYDAVAYFTDGKPVLGDSSYAIRWQGATWRFASEANLQRFSRNPSGYAPKFGGYCAWAVGHHYTADGDPEAWSIVDGRLYLNYNIEVRTMWLKELPDLIVRGEQNWPRLLGKQ